MNKDASAHGHGRLLLAFVVIVSVTVSAQPPSDKIVLQSEYAITERGPHHNLVSREVQVQDESGEIITREHSYVELATGMNYLENGEWKPADPTIEIVEGGAVALKLQQKIIFSPNLMDEAGAVDFQTPDGKHLRAAPLALAYYDPVTGQDAIIAVTKASVGEVQGASRVVYPDAFDGIEADIVYDVRLSGFSQDIVLLEQLPPAEDYGLNSELVRLEVLTEFLEAPEPQKEVRVISGVDDPVLRAVMVSPDFVDKELTFGEMRFGQGRAFSNNQSESEADGDIDSGVKVGKRWVEQGGRKVLFESVDFFSISPFLEELPEGDNQASLDNRRNFRIVCFGIAWLAFTVVGLPIHN